MKDLFGEDIPEEGKGALARAFGIPPFSVLNAREGNWQNRKRAWIALGIQSELGRGAELTWETEQGKQKLATGRNPARCFGQDLMKGENPNFPHKDNMEGKSNLLGHPDTTGDLTFYAQKRAKEKELGCELSTDEFRQKYYVPAEGEIHSGTSIFDPTLCELAYRWFCPTGGIILDPTAGGSVRGIVAAKLGHGYVGIDLRPEQIAANEKQREMICPDANLKWIVGDAQDTAKLVGDTRFDFIFSCPPYFDLEQYSDDKKDLSNMGWLDFCAAYQNIIKQAVDALKPNRFACFIVGDIRDKQGFYRNFPCVTIKAFWLAGAKLYNDAILITAVGSLPIRVGKQFGGYRKLGKTHQNVLVFYKGDPKEIKGNFGDVETKADLG